MVEPRTVWLFRPRIEGIPREGELSLRDGTLRFAGSNGKDFDLPLSAVRRAKRLRASPVLQVSYRRDRERRVAFYFFTTPPELTGAWRGSPISRVERRGRRQAFGWLTERSHDERRLIARWVEEIRAGARSA